LRAGFEREVAGIEKTNIGVGDVAPESFGARRQKVVPCRVAIVPGTDSLSHVCH
jgi:hypothetical protein